MAQSSPEKDALYNRQRSIESDLSAASNAIAGAEGQVSSTDASIGGLSGRLASVRGRGYSAMGHLDKTIEILSKKWADVGPAVKQSVATNLQPMGAQVRQLQGEAQTLRAEIDQNNLPGAESLAGRLAPDAASTKSRVESEAAQVTSPIRDLSAGVISVDRDLKIAESTVTLFGEASFPLKQQESPVLALQGKMMEGEKPHGVLYFTNQRFIFEGLKEVVLEKHMFIATKKRIERVSMIDQPVGAVQEVSKGRVGLIAGTGIYVQFHPQAGLPVTPFDVASGEADVSIRFFRYISGGDADHDIASVRGVPPPSGTVPKLVRCPSCGAPPSGEIFRGQTSVSCEYCGTTMPVG